jgi:NAD(P) transhydrogenase
LKVEQTLPSKTLRETAWPCRTFRSRNLYGVDLSLRREVTVPDFLGHQEQVKHAFHWSLTQQLEGLNAMLYHGTCRFLDAHAVQIGPVPEVGGKDATVPDGQIQLRGGKILIATGSSPAHPDVFPFGDCAIYDSDTILTLTRIPRTLAVVGAGVIGAEYGRTFRALGTEVHIVDERDVLLPFLDAELSRALAGALQRSGIVFHWKENVQKCIPLEAGTVRLELSSGAVLTADAVLVAAGRQSNTAKLKLEKPGVTLGGRGIIPVNEHFQTNVENIYAAGDVIGFPALYSTSAEQARRAVRHALGRLGGSALPPLLPNGIYTIPEVSMIGETEESLKQKGIAYGGHDGPQPRWAAAPRRRPEKRYADKACDARLPAALTCESAGSGRHGRSRALNPASGRGSTSTPLIRSGGKNHPLWSSTRRGG